MKQINLNENNPFHMAVLSVLEIQQAKGDDYALDDDPWSNFRFTAAAMGSDMWDVCDVFILTKYARLQALRENGRGPANESVLDSRLDIAVYALLAYAMMLDDIPQAPLLRPVHTVTEGI
jgi:hypothetical protein